MPPTEDFLNAFGLSWRGWAALDVAKVIQRFNGTVTNLHLKLCKEECENTPPGEAWDGAIALDEK